MAKPAPRPPKTAVSPAETTAAPPVTVVAPPPAWWLPVTLVLYGLLALVYMAATPLQPITLPDNLPAVRAQTPLTVGIGPDEKEHFLYIASLAERGRLPAQAPAFRASPDDYVSYEVQHPPLFFALAAVLYKLFLPLGIVPLWFVLRGACVLCGAGVIVLVHKTARRAFPDRPLVVWGAAPVCAFLPTFGHTMANLSNEPLASLIGAFLWWQIVRLFRSDKTVGLRPALWLGLTFGAGLVTKLTVIVWLPAACIALLFWARRNKQNPLLVFGAFGLPAALCAAPWFGYLYAHFGTFAFRSHVRPLLQDVSPLDYLRDPAQKLFPKNVPRGVVMPPSYLLLWGVSTAIVPFWLVFAYLPGGPAFMLLWQIAFLLALLVPLLALGRHSARSRAEKTQNYPAERALLWAGGSALLMAVLTLLYQIFKVDWSMSNYGGRYTIAAWPAACLVILFALSTLPEPGPQNARRQRTAAFVVAAALLVLDLCTACGVRAFYLANPKQPDVQRSEEVAFGASRRDVFPDDGFQLSPLRVFWRLTGTG